MKERKKKLRKEGPKLRQVLRSFCPFVDTSSDRPDDMEFHRRQSVLPYEIRVLVLVPGHLSPPTMSALFVGSVGVRDS